VTIGLPPDTIFEDLNDEQKIPTSQCCFHQIKRVQVVVFLVRERIKRAFLDKRGRIYWAAAAASENVKKRNCRTSKIISELIALIERNALFPKYT
jgi:hypothetical protein